MSTIVLRSTKGSALTFAEGDANFSNLNNDKLENITNESIGDLSDVDLTNVGEGSVLKYSTSSSGFVVGTDTGGIALSDLSVGSEAQASGNGAISYNNSTGVFTYTPPTAAGLGALTDITGESIGDLTNVNLTNVSEGSILKWSSSSSEFVVATDTGIALSDLSVGAEGSASGNGSIAYNNSTGVFTYTPPDLSSYATSASLATVATSGSYNDLTNLPTIPTNNNQLTNGAGYITDYTTELSEDTSPVLSAELVCGGNVISNPTLEDYKETIHSLGTTDNPTIAVSNGNVQTITISSGLSLPAFSDAAAGQSVTLIVSGSGTASGTAAYKFAGGNTTLTTSSVVSIFYDGTTYWASIATDFQ